MRDAELAISGAIFLVIFGGLLIGHVRLPQEEEVMGRFRAARVHFGLAMLTLGSLCALGVGIFRLITK